MAVRGGVARRAVLAALSGMVLALPVSAGEALRIAFGALTLEGSGGVEVPGLAALPAGLDRDFVIRDGVIAPSGAGDEVNLSRGPYRGVLPDGRALEISVLPGTYSVASLTELQATAANPDLGYGESILLRDGSYDWSPAEDVLLARAVPPKGVPETDGPVLVSSHSDGGAVIDHIKLGRNTDRFAYRGLVFRTKRKAGAKYRASVQITGPLSDLVFEGNTFAYGSRIDGSEQDVVSGIFVPGTVKVDRMKVLRNRFDGVQTSVGALNGDEIEIDGNEIRRATGDDIRINKGRGIRITNNLLTDKVQAVRSFRVTGIRSDGRGGMFISVDRPLPKGKAVENVLLTPDTGIDPNLTRRQFNYRLDFDRGRDIQGAAIHLRKVDQRLLRRSYSGGGRLLVTGTHGDAIQIFPTKFRPGELDGMTISGNAILIGRGSMGFTLRQGGIWSQGGRSKDKKRGWSIVGNVIEHTGRNALVVGGLQDARIWSNVVVRRLGYPRISGISRSLIIVNGTGSVYDNIANGFDLKGWRGPIAGNVEVPADSVAAYRRYFRSPTVGDAEYRGPDYGMGAYSPARGAPSTAGLAGWDFALRYYKGSR